MKSFTLALLLTMISCVSFAEQRFYEMDKAPDLNGYVTKVASSSELDVNASRVVIGPETRIYLHKENWVYTLKSSDTRPYVAQRAKVFGKRKRGDFRLLATELNLYVPKERQVHGEAVVESVEDAAGPGDHLVHADGYTIFIPATAKVEFIEPLKSSTGFRSNLWVKYQGKLKPSAGVVAESVTIRKNDISDREDSLRSKTEYDPAAVDPNAKQGKLSKAFVGVDPTQVPPYKDEAMQRRLSSVGESLIPHYQRELAQNDPTRINFRFQLVDEPHWTGALSWPNGIILVPYQLVQHLTDDSWLAAVLAVNVAEVIEKAEYRTNWILASTKSAQVVAHTLVAWVPWLGLGVSIADSAPEKAAQEIRIEQPLRVSLSLLQDAGYDVKQAPLAWWALARLSNKLRDGTTPQYVTYLYQLLDEGWPHE